MKAPTFWRTVTADEVDLLGQLIELFDSHGIQYCVIGGQAVNAYADPLVSLDLDVVVAADDLGRSAHILSERFEVKRFPHSLNISSPNSDLRVQIQLDPRYAEFPRRAVMAKVLGVGLPVAALEDVLQGKIWAALDTSRRPSNRQKDLADIARLIEAHPKLRDRVPPEIIAKLVM